MVECCWSFCSTNREEEDYEEGGGMFRFEKRIRGQ